MSTGTLARAFLILAIFTTSFDIFLVFRFGFTFRIAQLFLAIPFGYTLLQAIRRPIVKWPLGYTYLLIWAFFLAIFIPNTDFPLRSIGYWLWLAFNTAMVFTTVQLIESYQQVLSIVRWYLYSYLFVAAFGIFQFFAPRLGLGSPLIVEWWFLGSLPRVNGFSYEPSYYASYLVMGWVLTLYLLNTRATFISQKRLKLIAIVTTLALILSSSRAGILTMLIWLAHYPAQLIWRLIQGYLNKKLLTITSVLALFLLSIAVVIRMIGLSNIEFLFTGLGLMGKAGHSVSNRTNELRDTLMIFTQSPIIGYSLGGISSAIGHLRGVDVTSLGLAKQNEGMSIFAEALAASGIAGIIPFVIYVYKIFNDPLRLANNTFDHNYRAVLFGFTYSLIVEMMILQFNGNILRIYLWMHISLLSSIYSIGEAGAKRLIDSTDSYTHSPLNKVSHE